MSIEKHPIRDLGAADTQMVVTALIVGIEFEKKVTGDSSPLSAVPTTRGFRNYNVSERRMAVTIVDGDRLERLRKKGCK
jgi:hypothetical protein